MQGRLFMGITIKTERVLRPRQEDCQLRIFPYLLDKITSSESQSFPPLSLSCSSVTYHVTTCSERDFRHH